jgi:hypothetical protein
MCQVLPTCLFLYASESQSSPQKGSLYSATSWTGTADVDEINKYNKINWLLELYVSDLLLFFSQFKDPQREVTQLVHRRGCDFIC